MLFGVGLSCRVVNAIVRYVYVSCNVSIASVGKRELICFTCNYVVSERFSFSLSAWAFHIIIYCLIESSHEV